MAKKIILEDSQGNVLHPKTLGECVTTETGETVDGLVSKSQMFSPIIETDSSMSKVGVGTDIDVSLNVKDGAYEECVFEGRSLVNLFSRVSHAVGIWGREDSSSSLLKPNTRYTVSIQKLPPNCQWTLTIDVNGVSTMMFPYLNSSNKIAFDTLENVGTVMMIHLNDGGTTEITKDMIDEMKPMVIEGDYTKVDIPYFIGLCDVKMPILRNVGKNLLDESTLIVSNNDTIYIRKYGKFPCKPNTKYRFISSKGESACNWYYYKDGNDNPVYGEYSATTTTPSGCHYLHIHTGNSLSINPTTIKTMVVEDGQDVTYEDHKTNILRTSEEIVLRSVGDIKDSYNALTGEYVQRIVEYVFNGSESEAWHFAEMKGDNYRFSINLPTFGNKSADKTALICDRLKVGNIAQEPKQEQIATYNHDSNFELRITLSPSTLASDNVGELRRYLQANPIAIQYAVAEPITTIIKPSTIPFAYANGHMVLESGSSEQSLLPHLKYSVVTGRTGQVTQNTKVLRKQEQQIIGLEELLLTQIVQMEYERTLLQFDYELQMMMLG